MPRGDDIDYAIRRLKRSAIDAFMRNHPPYFRIDDQHTIARRNPSTEVLEEYHCSTGFFRHDVYMYVTRPDGDGEGGGLMPLSGGEYQQGPHVSEFDDVRTGIDTVTGRWRQLPDRTKIQGLRDEFHAEVYERFLYNLRDGDNVKFPEEGKGSLSFNVGVLWRALFNADAADELLSGSAMEVFKGYFQEFTNAVVACSEIVDVIDKSIEAECILWENAPYDAAQTIHVIGGACDKIAHGSSCRPDLSILTVALIALGVVSLGSGPMAAVLGKADLALSIVTSGGGDNFSAIDYGDPPRDPIPTHSGAIEVLSLLLNGSHSGVGQSVTATEQAIDNTLRTAIYEIDANRRLFDPTPGPITCVPPRLKYDPDEAQRIVNFMNAVGDELSIVAGKIQGCRDLLPGLLRRHSRIGIGPDGPGDTLDQLMNMVKMLIVELAAEAHAGANNFEAAMGVLAQGQANSLALLQEMANEFAAADVSEFDVYQWERERPSHPGHEYYNWLQRRPDISHLEAGMS